MHIMYTFCKKPIQKTWEEADVKEDEDSNTA